MNATWTLPNNVRLVGESAFTVLEDQSSTFTGSNLITMGSSGCSSSMICSGISVEHLQLKQTNHSLGGIVNQYAEQSSYVNDVTLQNLGGTGILIEAPNSGPYTDIVFIADPNMSSCSGTSCPVCVDIEAQTQGLHGITCHGNAATAVYVPDQDVSAGIRVNASNNSLEDVHIEAFWDGIRVGDEVSATANNIVLLNVHGSKDPYGTVTNVVHICGGLPSSQYGMCPHYGSVSNLTVLGANDLNNTSYTSCPPMSPYTCSTAIQDDVTGTSIAAAASTGNTATGIQVGFYALGGEIGTSSGIYSRFAITASFTPATDGTPTPSWGVGTTAVGGSSCLTPGALYSNTLANSGTSSVYVCTGGSWTSIP